METRGMPMAFDGDEHEPALRLSLERLEHELEIWT